MSRFFEPASLSDRSGVKRSVKSRAGSKCRRTFQHRRSLRQHRVSRHLLLEPLESRRVLAITVDMFEDVVADDGYTSLREAIAQVDDDGVPDTIILPHTINEVEGTYTLELGELAIDDADALTIVSDGGLATIDALGASRVFNIAAVSDVTLNGLVITGGYSVEGGGGVLNWGRLTTENTTIQGNIAVDGGGGLWNVGFGLAELIHTRVEGNYTDNYGGAIANTGIFGSEASMVITDCTFLNNTAGINGGAIDNNGDLVISESYFEGNLAYSAGGAIGNGGTLTLSDTVFTSNTAYGNGGGIFNIATDEMFPSEMYLTNVTFTRNISQGGSGGAMSTWGTATISDSSFVGNQASNGGGAIDNYVGTLAIDHTQFDSNVAGTSGGAIQNYDATWLEIVSSSITNNTASYDGGGIVNSFRPVSISGTSISGNMATYGNGGGLANFSGSADISGSVIEANTASYSGGGVYNEGTLYVNASEILDNSAEYGLGGGLYISGYSPTITGNLVSGNQNGGLVLEGYYAVVTGNSITDNVGEGILIAGGSYNTIGTIDEGAGNTITGNSGAGVAVGEYATYNTIRGNAIHSNGGLAIDLGTDGRSSNDPGDGDYGANDLQNHPVITGFTPGATTHVTGRLSSAPYSSFTIDIYAQTGAVPVNPGSSIRYLGSVDVVTDEEGKATFDVMLDAETFAGELVSATTTDLYGNTSEFSDFNLITVARVAGLFTSEGGAQATFSVVLAIEPTADVTVALSSLDTTEGVVSPAALTFTPDKWDDPQCATITGVDDTEADGPVSYMISTQPAMSADARFEAFDPDDVQVVNYDDEFAHHTQIEPPGSLIYESALEGVIDTPGHTESYSLLLDPGQTLSVLVEPSADLQPKIEVFAPNGTRVGSATAPVAGADAFVQTIRIPGKIASSDVAPMTYRIVVQGANGTVGAYSISTCLNAALETELHNGPANDAIESAQNLEGSFISLHNANSNGNAPQPQRGAVLGQITVDASDPTDWYRFDLRSGQSATVALTVLEGTDAQVALVGPDGTTLAAGSPDQADDVDQIISNFVATSTGTYYLKVNSDYDATYSVVVTRNADFETERNGTMETAQELLVPESGGRRWIMGSIGSSAVKVIDAFDSGSYGPQGDTNPADTDYYTGYSARGYGGEHRSYFAFDLEDLADEDTILGAEFRVDTARWYSDDSFETLNISEVVTPVDQLVAGEPGSVDIFDDLGDGTVFGSRDVWSYENYSVISVDLTSDAVAAISAAKGQEFALGGALTTLDDNYYKFENIFAWAGDSSNTRQLALTVADKDYYAITADGNKTIEIETLTPADQSGGFCNNLDSFVRLYDAAGNLVAWNDNGASDGRNAKLSHKVPKNAGGTYYVEVVASPLTAELTTGEYILSVKGAISAMPPFQVVSSDPSDGTRLRGPLTEYTVDFNDNVMLTTLSSGDMTFNGIAATAVTVVDGDTATFTVPGLFGDEMVDVAIAAGAIKDVQGMPIEAFTATYYNDVTPPRITDSSIQDGQTDLRPGDLVYTVTFSEAMNTSVDSYGGVPLRNVSWRLLRSREHRFRCHRHHGDTDLHRLAR